MAGLALIGGAASRFGSGRSSSIVELVAGVSAAPGLLIAGAPFSDNSRYPMAVLGSIPLWLILGFVASRRATATTIASWRDYWRELLMLTLAVVIGAIVALVATTAILGESLVV